MVSLNQFLKVFKDSDFDRAALRSFYRSVQKTVIHLHLGKRSWHDIFDLEERHQWPILRKIDDPELPLYRGADPELLDAFLQTISREKDLRANKRSIEKVKYWSALQEIIEERSGLFISIFNYSSRDIRRAKAVAERYKDISGGRKKKQLAAVGIGLGAGAAAAAAGAAALWYISIKDKK